MRRKSGFTLAELLIALAILGVIATFTIPKVLQSQQDGKFKAMAKETASMISGAYDAYRLKNTPNSGTGTFSLTPYMNYVAIDSVSIVDSHYTANTYDCSAVTCLKLHNGGTLVYWWATFSGTNSTNTIYYLFDPDSKAAGSPTGEGKAVEFFLYYDGRLTTYANVLPGSASSDGSIPVGADPPWFSWN